jgi:hypothetical protein
MQINILVHCKSLTVKHIPTGYKPGIRYTSEIARPFKQLEIQKK